MSVNPYEATRREEKAAKIARALRDSGATREQAAQLAGEGRRIVERAAGVKESSDETWRLALQKLDRMLEWKRDPLALPDDPLEGLPKGPRG